MNLDKFLQKKTEEIFIIKDKEYVADVSSLSFMKIVEMESKKLSELEQTQQALEIVFGKEKADELWNLLNVTGLQKIIERITELMEIEVADTIKK